MKHLTLKGLQILNTRPDFDEASALLSDKIQQLNGISIALPLQEIQGLDQKSWQVRLQKAPAIDIIIFVSRPSVEFFFKSQPKPLPENLADCQFYAIGSATAKKLEQFVKVSHFEKISSSENLFETLSSQDLRQKHILIVRGQHGRQWLQTKFRQAQAFVTELNVYQSLAINYPVEQLKFLWEDNKINVVLFTSEQAMNHLWESLPIIGKTWLQTKVVLVLSERLKKRCHQLIGAKTYVAAHDQIIESLLQLKDDAIKG